MQRATYAGSSSGGGGGGGGNATIRADEARAFPSAIAPACATHVREEKVRTSRHILELLRTWCELANRDCVLTQQAPPQLQQPVVVGGAVGETGSVGWFAASLSVCLSVCLAVGPSVRPSVERIARWHAAPVGLAVGHEPGREASFQSFVASLLLSVIQ